MKHIWMLYEFGSQASATHSQFLPDRSWLRALWLCYQDLIRARYSYRPGEEESSVCLHETPHDQENHFGEGQCPIQSGGVVFLGFQIGKWNCKNNYPLYILSPTQLMNPISNPKVILEGGQLEQSSLNEFLAFFKACSMLAHCSRCLHLDMECQIFICLGRVLPRPRRKNKTTTIYNTNVDLVRPKDW